MNKKDQKKNDQEKLPDWMIFTGQSEPHEIAEMPKTPPWRKASTRGKTYQTTREQARIVNAALFLRRPLLLTGHPGVGKSSLAYAVAEELMLGKVLRWPITSRSTLADGLYRYDAIGRMQDAELNPGAAPNIGKYLSLGPLGTALLPTSRPRVLLIDEIDKSDIDLPNDLLNIFEEGEFEIPELARHPESKIKVREFESDAEMEIMNGRVRCNEFPFVVMTSNGEREFPAPFLRRCLRLTIQPPSEAELGKIVEAHLAEHFGEDKEWRSQSQVLISKFLERRDGSGGQLLASDQLLNAIFLLAKAPAGETKDELIYALLKPLGREDAFGGD